ncbi:putative phage tail assembly chaperone [Vibrio mediterranei]|jgi:hypothetical protein|uniref:Phage tail protein n=1 Tax=Vibrio mediterranei TaxID=689 RepID=A0A3G4VFD4_9VIBR|nr:MULTISPECIES: putative phage tail assembly chaperone [Vibrio]EHK9608883.1 hypothetical protein [Vibrio parahaemolyticus]AYV22352.1 hypothetical protein ECB94_14395 [Vibrio mediterranei]EJG1272406.1 hypothetical protein [Vibrio parahaemolyticus]MCF9164209.1 hypothetical protein [Vibrio parahaemolyticus]MCF9177708.1 hypothetical protein [Vibrio parahaemolyticus]
MSKKTIVLTIAGSDIQFAPTPELYGEYVGAMARGDMTDSAHNFVMQSAQGDEEKETLRKLDEDNAGAMIQVAGTLVGEYAPKVAISVKK